MRAALARRGNLYLRVAATVMIALILHVFMNASWTWLWVGTYAAAQLVELVLIRQMLRQPSPGRALRLAVAAMPAITSTIFGFLSIPLFASSIRFAPTLGGLLLAGALLNVIVVNSSLRSATISAAAPHVAYLLIAPFVARWANPASALASALWFGVLLLILSVFVAARTLERALNAEAAAKEEAERRRHEAEEAVAAKSAFVAMISHELRTPISAILAGAARLHSDLPDAASKTHAQLIGDAGAMMRTLLNDLLDLSRLDAGRMAVEQAPFDLRQAMADTLRLWRPDAQKKGLRLRVEGAANLPRWVAGDTLRLRQVLNNLLSNAIKFTGQGAVTVRLAAREAGDGLMFEAVVADTGQGLTEEQMARLFTPFDQLAANVAREHGGSGLGLVISRELARLMGGDLTVTSKPGKGSRFRLEVRLEAAQAPDARTGGAVIDGARVLVVDDHVVNRRALELVLQSFGIQPTLAESGERALELLHSEVFDVMLMDVYMPGMDGRDATRELRAAEGPNRHIPVIAVTASATAKDWEACHAAGMNAHVAKPIDPSQLHAALSELLPVSASRAAA
ncbi:ATP-binding protein [Caulobacter rhizosphaerae]|jgi:signal transduction histidine kinase/CheY-like chemotaxis protein|uniref:ATP-binding protein n=1 Tax=Caulobacter rhizosphaerae TaxID=2010972 RepID=UPI0013D3E1DE|nr:ATP-binding protein [Caulobacter rhizosphaerae]GGL19066.1 hybrid sensor histidine kinase/response regulator [Caulobacter rhizosphaerae]